MNRLGSCVVAVLATTSLLACSDAAQTAPTQLNIDRPVDVSFACYGGLRTTADNIVHTTAQPVEGCNIRSGPRANVNDKPVPPGQEDQPGAPVPSAAWYAFILQSGPGTVGIARFDTKPSSLFAGGDVTMQDADPLTPGKNSISVGEDPIAIATDKSGCYEVIANAGSCDLSVLDVNSAVASIYTPEQGTAIVNRYNITNTAGTPIRAKPAAMVFEPAGSFHADACPMQPTGLAYIAFPSCHLVAGVDVSTGTMVTGMVFDPTTGVPSDVDVSTFTCPDECGGITAPTPGVRPVALDLELDTRPVTPRPLLAIGADNSNVVRVYDLDPTSFHQLSQTPVVLENTNGRLGVTGVSISPVIGMGGVSGMIDDDVQSSQHQFVYAVANDRTVRVGDISTPGVAFECDTQVDPRYIHDVRDIDKLSCFKVGDAATPPRRALARGPGIELIGDAVPTSVAIFKVPAIDGDSRVPGTPSRLIGYFAIVSAANGQSYVVNVDNDDFADFVNPGAGGDLSTPIPLDIAHQLRDALPNRGLLAQKAEDNGGGLKFVCDDPGPDPASTAGNAGGPRSTAAPSRTVPAGTIAPEKAGGLPSIHQVLCTPELTGAKPQPITELQFSAPIPVREAEFPDLRSLRSDELWTMTWEGSLSLDPVGAAIDGPNVRYSQTFVDGGGFRLVDQTRPFCDAGVEPYDIVQMRGCDPSLGDAGCPVGYTCFVHPQSQVAGLGACMLVDEAERLANACREYLVSERRYTVGRTQSGELRLLPRKSVLRTTPLDGCTSDDQCHELANYALHNVNSVNPKDDTSAEDKHIYMCKADPDRAPLGGTGKRCISACENDNDCSVGTVCHADSTAAPHVGYCMEGVVPPQSCVNAPQRYELRAGEAFAVVGSRQGYLHPIIADAGGNCIKDPTANPMKVGRIPLVAPACDPTADPRTGKLPAGGFEPNPCKTTVDETEYQLNYVPGTCTLGTPDENLVTRPAEAIRLRNPGITLTLVDPTYPGDAQCHGDHALGLTNVPLTAPGFQIAFTQTAGFTPLLLGITPSFPVKVIRGPQESIWVVDEGDYLSTSLNTASTRGKVFRVESQALGVINLLQ